MTTDRQFLAIGRIRGGQVELLAPVELTARPSVKPILHDVENVARSTVVRTWWPKGTTLAEARNWWFTRYHPAGYGTTVLIDEEPESGHLVTIMRRAASCD